MTKRSWLAALTVCGLLGGCTIPSSPSPSGSSASGPVTGSAAATAASSAAAAGSGGASAALARVRSASTMPQEVASAPITAKGNLNGGTLHVYEVRSGGASTKLVWAVTHPSLTADATDLEIYGAEAENPNVPVLKTAATVLHPIEAQQTLVSDRWTMAAPSSRKIQPEPKPSYALYPPLPAGTSEVEVSTPLISSPLKVSVTQGAAPAASGAVPLVGVQRARLLGPLASLSDKPADFVVALHAVRRVQSGTVVYYSLSLPDGGPTTPLSGGFYSEPFSRSALGGSPIGAMAAVVDRGTMTAFTQIGSPSSPQGCSDLHGEQLTAEAGVVCPALLPELPASTRTVDVELLGTTVFQDVPVEDGALSPATTKPLFSDKTGATLGDGWPVLPDSSFAMLNDPAQLAAAKTTIRDVVTDGAVTTSGHQQVDLNTQVLFEYNKATLTPAASAQLQKAADAIKKAGKPGALVVTGHTDSDGEDAANLTLSKQRAKAVADALQPMLPGYTFTVDGKGETEPVAPNDTDAGKAMNRRVTIVIGS